MTRVGFILPYCGWQTSQHSVTDVLGRSTPHAPSLVGALHWQDTGGGASGQDSTDRRQMQGLGRMRQSVSTPSLASMAGMPARASIRRSPMVSATPQTAMLSTMRYVPCVYLYVRACVRVCMRASVPWGAEERRCQRNVSGCCLQAAWRFHRCEARRIKHELDITRPANAGHVTGPCGRRDGSAWSEQQHGRRQRWWRAFPARLHR